MVIKSYLVNIIRITAREFIFINGALLLINGYTREPIFSIGPVMEKEGEAHNFREAKQNMFRSEDVFINRLSMFRK